MFAVHGGCSLVLWQVTVRKECSASFFVETVKTKVLQGEKMAIVSSKTTSPTK